MKDAAANPGLRFALTPLALSAALFLAACGGGDDNADTATAAAAAPAISVQPTEQAVTSGTVATFSVTASGSSLSYQWQSSAYGGTTWVDISGATAAIYSVDSTNASVNGTKYRVVITSGGQSVTSSPVSLTVNTVVTAPAISVDVAALAVNAGADAVFSVTASGTSLAYQWQVSTDGTAFTDISGATAATLTLPAVAVADSGKVVRVSVSNGAGTVTSTAAPLYVTAAVVDATLVSQPTNASAIAPNTATFTVTATGTPAPTYQWQKSTDAGVTWVDIAGATAASYTTPATAVADSGSLYRVNATNATATVTSNAAALTVASAPVAVAITTQPTALSITVPSTATFSVVATGSPTPTYQWQVKGVGGTAFANITGATSASYTTPATVVADNGKQFQVVVTNSSGSVTSAPVTLTAMAATTVSNLTGRAWTTGVSLESGDASVDSNSVDIDDAGNAIALFVKSDGTRRVLYATRGIPGAAGTAPVWGAPVAIDTAAAPASDLSANGNVYPRVLTVAPNGNAIVTWRSTAPCTASTYETNVNSTCSYLFSSRYSVTANTWSAPTKLADSPSNYFGMLQRFNSNGDLAIFYPGWVQNANTYATKPAVLWQAAGQTAFQTRVFSELSDFDIGLDKDGNMLVAGSASQNSTTDLVAYRGSVSTGFGAQELLEQRNSPATFEALAVGLNGQAVVMWHQNNGTATVRLSADIATPTGTWNQKQLSSYDAGTPRLYVNDAGDSVFEIICSFGSRGTVQKLSGGVWSGSQRLPASFDSCTTYAPVANRNGDLLVLSGSEWSTYDVASNAVIRANVSGSLSVYGTSGGSIGTYSAALSVSGLGVLSEAVAYDTLPTPALPAGDGRNSVVNLWGLFLK